nr:cyclic nucleotide-binding domain-containing protein [Motilibacter aurantiacus]
MRGRVARPHTFRDRVDLLRAVPGLGTLPEAELERLALLLVPHVVHGGEDVIRQGEIGSAYWIVCHGAVDVIVDDEVVSTLGPGWGFGDLALRGGIPRSATVTAHGPTTLYSLGRSEYLAALQAAGSP